LVSIDFNGTFFSAIVDGLSTMVIEKRMAKVLAWYDNEMGYARRIVDLLQYMKEKER
jgi:glyceraldehyde 3-phosphate dehydrogenase